MKPPCKKKPNKMTCANCGEQMFRSIVDFNCTCCGKCGLRYDWKLVDRVGIESLFGAFGQEGSDEDFIRGVDALGGTTKTKRGKL